MILNCVTVDDEPLALELVNSFVQKTPFLNLVASFGKASEAIKELKNTKAHLVFLDINMPGITGIEIAGLLQKSAGYSSPKVIFSTAYNQFATESYQVDALDYLLKPYEYEDFLRAAQKGLDFFTKIITKDEPANEGALSVKSGYKRVVIPFGNIRYIRGLRNYVAIHLTNTNEKPVLTLATQKSVVEKLPPESFIRVQRSFVVAIDSVTAFSANSIWVGELEIKIGEQYKNEVIKTLKERFEGLK